MRICFLAGANSIHSYRWAKYFAERENEIHWISLASSSVDRIENVNLYEIKQFLVKVFHIFRAMPHVRRLIRTAIIQQEFHKHTIEYLSCNITTITYFTCANMHD